MTQPRIIFAVPSTENVKAQFAVALASMGIATVVKGIAVGVASAQGCYISSNRNLLVDQAREAQATHVMFLDSDMVFPPDTALRLLAWDEDIVGATYARRTPPYQSNLTLAPGTVVPPNGLVAAKVLPTGVMLVKLSVFDLLPRPWFFLSYDPKNPSPDYPDGLIGEDVHFCAGALRAGLKVYCDIGLSYQIGHIAEQVVMLGEG